MSLLAFIEIGKGYNHDNFIFIIIKIYVRYIL